MTDTSPSPFRRFPWVQLAFCVACLTMAAWTWMRYSYCWQMTRREISELGESFDKGHWPAGAYIEVESVGAPPTGEAGRSAEQTRTGHHRGRLRLVSVTGTVATSNLSISSAPYCFLEFRATSRFHPASIAGIVVGLMGCSVFGLYLRRWVKERR